MRRTLRAVALSTTLAIGGYGAAGITVPAAAHADAATAESVFVSRLNAERAHAGLAPLRVDWSLSEGARSWAAHQAASGDLSHDDGYFTNRPAGARTLGENVGFGHSADSVHEALMNSAGHRANILNPRFDAIGIGVVERANGSLFVTQRFAEFSSPAPAKASKASKAKAAKPKRAAKTRSSRARR
jgi:uncharacterized protein YkwD